MTRVYEHVCNGKPREECDPAHYSFLVYYEPHEMEPTVIAWRCFANSVPGEHGRLFYDPVTRVFFHLNRRLCEGEEQVYESVCKRLLEGGRYQLVREAAGFHRISYDEFLDRIMGHEYDILEI